MSYATDWDGRITTAVSVALEGKIGQDNDIKRLKAQIEDGPSEDKLHTACEIAVAFIRELADERAARIKYGAHKE